VIAQLVQADEDTVRDVIHWFNEIALACLDPQWAGGRPRLLNAFVVQTATTRPTKLGQPFTRWSIRVASSLFQTGSWCASRLRKSCRRPIGPSTVVRALSGAWGKPPARFGHSVVPYRLASRNRQNPNDSSAMVCPSLGVLRLDRTRRRAVAMSSRAR
jgi:hypothetical protein